MNMKPETAKAIYDILVRVCGASPELRDSFVAHITDGLHEWGEWRFGGNLGFGGKFWWNSRGEPFYVNYNENNTEERDKIVREANEQLAQLKIVGAEVFRAMLEKREALDSLDHAILDRIDFQARQAGFTRMTITKLNGDRFYKGRYEKKPTPEIVQLLELFCEEVCQWGFEAIWTYQKGWH